MAVIEEEPSECYQVMFSSSDSTVQYLNAVWEFNNMENAASAAQLSSELPLLEGVDFGNLEIPQIGSNSSATYAKISSPQGEIYIQNIFWNHGNIFCRLSVISLNPQNPPNINNLVPLALLIEERLQQ
jgi:hypothetical protein